MTYNSNGTIRGGASLPAGTMEISAAVWLATPPADRKRHKNGACFLRIRRAVKGRTPAGWQQVYWRQ